MELGQPKLRDPAEPAIPAKESPSLNGAEGGSEEKAKGDLIWEMCILGETL
jgi:hypothetical protein